MRLKTFCASCCGKREVLACSAELPAAPACGMLAGRRLSEREREEASTNAKIMVSESRGFICYECRREKLQRPMHQCPTPGSCEGLAAVSVRVEYYRR